MGGACSKNSVIVAEKVKKTSERPNKEIINTNIAPNLDPKFQDMPEWEGERYRGEGLKRMKGYKCNLKIDKLNALRDEFWNHKIKEKLIWRQLRQAVNMDDVRCAQALKQLNLRAVNGCVNYLVDDDKNYYYIPNFCINDPYLEKELNYAAPFVTDKKLKIFIYDLYANKKISVEISPDITGKELKSLYFKEIKEDVEKYKSRLLFGGVEIKDDHKIYQHNLKDDYQIQIIKILFD